jgi:uncharacterized protein DUF998
MKHKIPSLALLTFAFLALFPLIVIALHLVQRGQYHPLSQAVSELALGRAGWLMAIAFCSSGIGTLLLALVLRRSSARPSVAPVLLSLAGVLSFVSAFVHADPSAATTTSPHGRIHVLVGVATFLLIVAAMFSSVRAFRRSAEWLPLAMPTRVWAIVSVPLFLLIPLAGDAHFGLAQRAFLSVLFAWPLTVSLFAHRIERGEAHGLLPAVNRQAAA